MFLVIRDEWERTREGDKEVRFSLKRSKYHNLLNSILLPATVTELNAHF